MSEKKEKRNKKEYNMDSSNELLCVHGKWKFNLKNEENLSTVFRNKIRIIIIEKNIHTFFSFIKYIYACIYVCKFSNWTWREIFSIKTMSKQKRAKFETK